MKRLRVGLCVSVLMLSAGCVSDSIEPATEGSISLALVPEPPGAEGGPASVVAQASQPLQSVRVTVSGPTPKTATFQCAATCEGTIDGLAPGSYSVVVEGLIGSEVDHFGQTSGVTVVAGENSTATINFQSFRPVVSAFPVDTTEVLRFTVSYSAVAAATGYRVEYAQASDFSGATAVTVTGTSTEIVVTEEAEYFVRVRATNQVVSTGRWSDARSIVALQGVAVVTVAPGAPTIVDGATQQFTAEGRDGDNNVVSGITFFWSSSDHSVVTVDQTGLATAHGLGSATVTAVGKGQPGSAAVTVTFGPPDKLAFSVPPGDAEPDGPFTVEVEILDAEGNLTDATSDVTLALGNNVPGGTLSGTLTIAATSGLASFTDLSLDLAGDDYTLVASSSGLPNETSGAFDVFLDFVALTMGSQQAMACGLTRTGAAYCWGRNQGGAVGDGTMTDNNRPARVLGGHTFTSLSAGGLFSSVVSHVCGVRAGDGEVFCWGYGIDGQLGDGAAASSSVPVQVAGGHSFVSVSAGAQHTCGVRDDGAALCWGLGLSGRLGNNGTGQQNTPVLVSGNHTFATVDAGATHTCGVRTDNVLMCWGFGNPGQLGTGGTIGAIADALVPAPVAGTYRSVSAGASHTCAITLSRFVACWGTNTNGQFGDGGATSSSAPVVPSNHLIQFTRISAGDGHSCGVSTGLDAWCWGAGAGFLNRGQLGNGTLVGSTAPVLVAGGRQWTEINASRFTTVGATVGGGGFTWGNGINGERGDGTNSDSSTPAKVLGSR